jgi:DNA-binding response OmpR family regulator
MKLLVIDDNQASTQRLSKTLGKYYCVIDVASDSITGLDMIRQWEYDAVLLSFQLSGQSSLHLCRQLRQQGYGTPLLMLIPQADTDAAVVSLEAGADDCVPASAEARLLLARLRALQRRPAPELSNAVLSWGSLKLNMNQFRVSYCDAPVYLSSREYRLLELLLQHPNRIFTRDAILDKLWTIDDPPSAATVTNLVKDLRRKLKRAGVMGQPIKTVHGIGYQLNTPPELELPTIPNHDEPGRASAQLTAPQPLVGAFQQHLQACLEVINALDLALQQDTLTLDLQQQVRTIAHPFAVVVDVLGYCQASNILRTIDYFLVSTLPLPSAKVKRLQELICQLHHCLAQPPSRYVPVMVQSKITPGKVEASILDDDLSFARPENAV